MLVDVEPGMRTDAAVAWEAAVKTSLLVLALSLLDRGCCNSVYCSSSGCAAAKSTKRWWSTGSHPTESLEELNCMSSGYWICVSHGPKATVPRNPDGKKQRKNNHERKKITSAYAQAPFSTGQHMSRLMGRPVKSAGRPTKLSGRPI